jgi:undecaprenyl-diphosphatase
MAVFMLLGVTDSLDAATRAGINRWASPNLTALARGASFIGSSSVLFGLTALIAIGLWLGGRPRAALMLLLVMGIAAVVNNAIKLTFARARPEAFFGAVPDSYSFASGHALFSACFFSVVAGLIEAKLTRGWQRGVVWALAGSIIAGIGLSRIYLGVHYLTDVIAGFALAALIVCLVRSVVAEHR